MNTYSLHITYPPQTTYMRWMAEGKMIDNSTCRTRQGSQDKDTNGSNHATQR